jgi:hypothetical protein
MTVHPSPFCFFLSPPSHFSTSNPLSYFELHIESKGLVFEIPALAGEPVFASLALYNAMSLEKISSDFLFFSDVLRVVMSVSCYENLGNFRICFCHNSKFPREASALFAISVIFKKKLHKFLLFTTFSKRTASSPV